MNRRYDHSAYCCRCQRWILKTALASNNLGAQICPYCHRRVRAKRHLHDLPRKECSAFAEVLERSQIVCEVKKRMFKNSISRAK